MWKRLMSWLYTRPRFDRDVMRVDRVGWFTWDGEKWVNGKKDGA